MDDDLRWREGYKVEGQEPRSKQIKRATEANNVLSFDPQLASPQELTQPLKSSNPIQEDLNIKDTFLSVPNLVWFHDSSRISQFCLSCKCVVPPLPNFPQDLAVAAFPIATQEGQGSPIGRMGLLQFER